MRLTKHHGLGNDFLVLLDRDDAMPVTPELVRELCDRHLGIGADGLLRATPTPTDGVDARMELYNADGSVAEMSGNGIRCLGQALLLAGWTASDGQVVISTHAGVRTLAVHSESVFDDRRAGELNDRVGGTVDGPPGDRSGAAAGARAPTVVLSVDMGPAQILGEAPEWVGGAVRRALWADMGNPHLVALVDGGAAVAGSGGTASAAPDDVGAPADELVVLGEQVNAKVPAGANVHLVAVGPGDEVLMRTFERGVGLTQACGTGACAAASVAHHLGLVGPSVTVDMPGGRAVVEVGSTVTLTGPATAVAAIDYPWPA